MGGKKVSFVKVKHKKKHNLSFTTLQAPSLSLSLSTDPLRLLLEAIGVQVEIPPPLILSSADRIRQFECSQITI